eukprot:4491235-Prymnesium_polylepis.1
MGMVVAQRHGAAASAPQQARRHQIPRESATSRFGRAASHVKTAHYVVRPSLKSTQLPPSSIISTSSMRSSSEYLRNEGAARVSTRRAEARGEGGGGGVDRRAPAAHD